MRTLLAIALLACVSSPAAAQDTPGHPSGHGTNRPPAAPPSGHDARDGPDTAQDDGAHDAGPSGAAGPALPAITDADRAAAFPDLHGQHTVHDNAVHAFVLFDQLEWQGGSAGGVSWHTKGWVGRDIDRLWFRTEGESEDGDLASAEVHVLYGRAIARWWDVVAGVRQDLRPDPARTWAAVGIQGLAPYWFEVEATAYVGAGGRTHVRLESEYELLFTNRLVLQPLVEVNLHGKSDPERGIGAGLSSTEAGLRLRYEIRRELAPYVGVTWHTTYFGTADLARAAGEETGGARLALGLRAWF